MNVTATTLRNVAMNCTLHRHANSAVRYQVTPTGETNGTGCSGGGRNSPVPYVP